VRFTALVPLKRDSSRLPNKNFLKLAGKPLAYHIFNALLKVDSIDQVCAFSSSNEFMEHIPAGVEYIQRDPKLDLDSVRGLELLRAFAETVDSDYYILAHATSPFLTAGSIQRGVDGIRSGEYDSALAVQDIKKYFWYDGKPVNYDINDIVQTQYIQPVLIETSGFYMFSRDDILVKSRRIGDRPLLVTMGMIEGLDIDDYAEYETARRFQDILTESQDAPVQLQPGIRPDIKLVLFELDGPLAGPDEQLLEYAAPWLGVLAKQGKKIGVVARGNQERVAGILRESSVEPQLILTPNEGLAEPELAELAKQACQKTGISPRHSVYVGSSAQGRRVAELAGMDYLHAGWACQPDAKSETPSFETIADAAIHILESGRW
jgi:CMP-N-acetylneuraminic acid synthetase